MNLIVIAILFSLSVFAQHPDPQSCDYYLSIENDYQCGRGGYPLSSGYPLCKRYLKAGPYLSSRLKEWFPRIRLCLQNAIEDQRGTIRDCYDLRKKAIHSHVQCYKETRFCDLPKREVLTLARLTGTYMLKKDFLKLTLKLSTLCK